ncbi:MAG: hypothetical protein SFX72_13155 [Isosphaeraceae bacterium]|nr:hypothetical protein [Isosphaeraceae bacterium]
MNHRSHAGPPRIRTRRALVRALVAIASTSAAAAQTPSPTPAAPPSPTRPVAARAAIPEPFASFQPPVEWTERFWADPSTKRLLEADAKALAAMVPTQGGFRFCRCPNCDARESDDPLAWTPSAPEKLVCRRCGFTYPSAEVPAKADKEKWVFEEEIEVRPGRTHRYLYHVPTPEKATREDERIYLAAKRDYEAREYLSKAALYAALRHRDDRSGRPDPAWARVASVLLLQFARVYPDLACRYDQPGEPKFLQTAELRPPFRRGYKTGKWDFLGSLDVPINLVIAHAIVRDTPALAEAGRALGDPDPRRTIERDLFRASAAFVLAQSEEFAEASLPAYRGVLATARLLDDAALFSRVAARVDEFARRGFYHDGFWKQGDIRAHRRVLGQLDGWLDPLTSSGTDTEGRGSELSALLPLMRAASGAPLRPIERAEILPVAWAPPAENAGTRRPLLLGGAGVARLGVGEGPDALDIELRGQDGFGGVHFQRQAIRVAVGGVPLLDDLSERTILESGWNLSTASHNTILIDGLNQRETFERAREPVPGGSFVYFATSPDFQVATLDDPHAYPISGKRYRQTLVVSAGRTSRFALAVFDVEGGLQHDQIFHGRSGSRSTWTTTTELARRDGTLLPPSIPYLAARAEQGRWFVQALGEFHDLAEGTSRRAETAVIADAEGRGLRLHFLGDAPRTLIRATTPDVDDSAPGSAGDRRDERGRASLVVRRRSIDGATLASRFVTLFEPVSTERRPARVGRVLTGSRNVLLQIETEDGVEYLFVHEKPGTIVSEPLPDGRRLETDGLAVRIRGEELVLAGGLFAQVGATRVERTRIAGELSAAGRSEGVNRSSLGWFDTLGTIAVAEPLAGRTLLVRHGDGVTRAWTVDGVEPLEDGRSRIHVREESGFVIDAETGVARWYRFPATSHPGPHTFSVPGLSRSGD